MKSKEKTISFMMGKGSIAHNNRNFTAKNVDRERTDLDLILCCEDIKETYHKLFDKSVALYNAKQTRDDRKIGDYYEKIRTGKQEKTFKEVVVQIGNKDDTPADSPAGEEAKKILEEYYAGFVKRNRTLRVFNAAIHMDEATPHIHIDFVPFTTGSKRGLDTRVSLKKALSDLGFNGGTKGNTEWDQWVEAEKNELEKVMERYGIKRLDKGERREHLSVENFKAEMKHQEVKALDGQIDELNEDIEKLTEKKKSADKELSDAENKLTETAKKLSKLKEEEIKIKTDESEYRNSEEYKLPEPPMLITAKAYFKKYAFPLVDKLINIICSFCRKIKNLEKEIISLRFRNNNLKMSYDSEVSKNEKLSEDSKQLEILRSELDRNKINAIIKNYEEKQRMKYMRGREAEKENDWFTRDDDFER